MQFQFIEMPFFAFVRPMLGCLKKLLSEIDSDVVRINPLIKSSIHKFTFNYLVQSKFLLLGHSEMFTDESKSVKSLSYCSFPLMLKCRKPLIDKSFFLLDGLSEFYSESTPLIECHPDMKSSISIIKAIFFSTFLNNTI